ncbi:porin family protein [Rhodanobacter glycinis]|uniref:Porin family protein n=1 Tax=Rhodanobacter glycinis TaxID=582702 RepID=A0A5B9E6N9_9GAMM|nr:outer membrane beta-barrel protein [Rhodanobacter glycinis]QEE25766.1 porin family protein [Rhodanobacter glycinis]
MQRKIAVIALLTAGACMAASAQAKDLTGWFVNGNVGTIDYSASVNADGYSGSGSKTGGTAVLVNAGYRSQFIGVEAGYANLGSVKESDGNVNSKLSGDGWTLGINGHFNPTRMWYISARGGAFIWKLRAKLTATDIRGAFGIERASGSQQSLGWYGGVGTGVDFNSHWSVGANFDYYKMNGHGYDIGNKVYSVSAEYRF